MTYTFNPQQESPATIMRRDGAKLTKWGDYERTYACEVCGERTTAIVGMGAERYSRCNRHALEAIFGPDLD